MNPHPKSTKRYRSHCSARLLAAAACALVLATAGCATLRVGTDYDHQVSFATYHSFSLLAREHRGSSNPLVVQRARDAITAALMAKGFTLVSNASPDFVVDFTIGARERMEVSSYPAPYAGPWVNVYPYGWANMYWGAAVDVRMYREGTLAIDVFDAKTHRPVWHGWAQKELTRADLEHSEAPIREAVTQVLAGFPPR